MALNGVQVAGQTIQVIAVAVLGEQGYFIPQQEMHTQAVIGDIVPTVDPHIAGQLWKNAGVITISSG